MLDAEFKVGDIITSKKGTKSLPAMITGYSRDGGYSVRYVHNNHSNSISKLDAILYRGNSTMMTQEILYSFIKDDGTISYATYLATNSAGEWVVEELGTHKIHTRPEDSFTEVVPFTFSVKCGNDFSNIYNFTCEEGKVQIGDVLMQNGSIFQVIELNTKKRNAPAFTGVRLETKPF